LDGNPLELSDPPALPIDISQYLNVVVDPPEAQIGQMAPGAMTKKLGCGHDRPVMDVCIRGNDQSGQFTPEAMEFLNLLYKRR
jgi:hypothetical protein